MTTRDEISAWFDRGVAQKATRMLVVCDTFDHEDYPVFVFTDKEALEQFEHYHMKNMQKVMEVYDLRLSKSEQLSQHRVMHLPTATDSNQVAG